MSRERIGNNTQKEELKIRTEINGIEDGLSVERINETRVVILKRSIMFINP